MGTEEGACSRFRLALKRSGECGRGRQKEDGDCELGEREEQRERPGDRFGRAEADSGAASPLAVRQLATAATANTAASTSREANISASTIPSGADWRVEL